MVKAKKNKEKERKKERRKSHYFDIGNTMFRVTIDDILVLRWGCYIANL